MVPSAQSSHIRTDSGYASRGEMSGDDPYTPLPNKTFSARIRDRFSSKRVKPKLLQEYNRAMSDLVLSRFWELQQFINELLECWLNFDASRCRRISIKLKCLGESEGDAKPCIEVLCPQVDLDKVNQFFLQPHVRAQIQPLVPSFDRPSFGISVIPKPPVDMATSKPSETSFDTSSHSTAAELGVDDDAALDRRSPSLTDSEEIESDVIPFLSSYDEAVVESDSKAVYVRSSTDTSLVGSQIKISSDPSRGMGRVGGPVLVTYSNGISKLYAMTSGHIFDAEEHIERDITVPDATQNQHISSRVDSDQQLEESQCTMFEGEYCLYLDNAASQRFEVACLSAHIIDQTTNDDHTQHTSSQSEETVEDVVWKKIGTGPVELFGPQELDYALFELDDPSEFFNGTEEYIEYKPSNLSKNLHHDQKATIATSNYPLCSAEGVLLRSPALINARDTKRFVETYLLKLKHRIVKQGDSGAWVIDPIEKTVLGHIVAADDFGDVYVMPIMTCLDQIRLRLSAVSVTIPTKEEVQQICTSTSITASRSILQDNDRDEDWETVPEWDLISNYSQKFHGSNTSMIACYASSPQSGQTLQSLAVSERFTQLTTAYMGGWSSYSGWLSNNPLDYRPSNFWKIEIPRNYSAPLLNYRDRMELELLELLDQSIPSSDPGIDDQTLSLRIR